MPRDTALSHQRQSGAKRHSGSLVPRDTALSHQRQSGAKRHSSVSPAAGAALTCRLHAQHSHADSDSCWNSVAPLLYGGGTVHVRIRLQRPVPSGRRSTLGQLERHGVAPQRRRGRVQVLLGCLHVRLARKGRHVLREGAVQRL